MRGDVQAALPMRVTIAARSSVWPIQYGEDKGKSVPGYDIWKTTYENPDVLDLISRRSRATKND